MSVFKSKTIQITLLALSSLMNQSTVPYIIALLLPFIPINKSSYILLSTIITLLTILSQIIFYNKYIYIEIFMFVIVIISYIYYHGLPWKQKYINIIKNVKQQIPISSKYLIFIYLFVYSFLSLSNNYVIHNITLILLFIMLFLYSIKASATLNLRIFIILCYILSIIWGILSYTIKNININNNIINYLKNQQKQQWWFYIMNCFSVWIGYMLAYQIQIQQNPNYQRYTENNNQDGSGRISQIKHYSNNQKQNNNIVMIQMNDLSKSRHSQGDIIENNQNNNNKSDVDNNYNIKIKDIRKSIQQQQNNNINKQQKQLNKIHINKLKLPPLPTEIIKNNSNNKQLIQKLLKSDQQDQFDKKIQLKRRQLARSAIIKGQQQQPNMKSNKNIKIIQKTPNNNNKQRQRSISTVINGYHTVHHSPRNIQHIKNPYSSLKSTVHHHHHSHQQPNQFNINQNNNSWSQHQGQGQITNLFLLIPFTLFSPTYLQIPIYFYLIYLQSGKTPMFVFYIMLFSICGITYYSQLHQYSNIQQNKQYKLSLFVKILLRLCLILIVNKNFKLAINITTVLRSIWLRSSFVFVLLVLFWFSLLTVNIFHISFVLIVLLFITNNTNPNKNNNSNNNNNNKDTQPSFRHKNWKYLVLLFNTFLILRLIWLILYKDFSISEHISKRFYDILSLFGITYSYNLHWQYFNMIPLIVSGVLTVQYWTYSSRIYDMESKKNTIQFLPTYRTLILKLVQIFTIIYYKIIPWTTHIVVIVIIISLQFSLIADFVLIWSLFILLVHMIKPNQVSAYRSMYKMWNIFLKLVSIQIILRYIFQFIKFPIIFNNISDIPIINTLIQYQQILGLAIRESSNSYLKNIFTKFQLMMILDFSIIAISFLAIQYYEIMIKYYQIQQKKQVSQKSIIKTQNISQNNNKLQLPQHPQINNKQYLHQSQKIQNKQNIISQSITQQNKLSQTLSSHDAIYIYENYIDFKLTKWLQNFNQLMILFSKLFLKIYYPFIATYSCIYYSYATMTYFLCSVYYYLKINTKYYQIDVLSQVQPRIIKLFSLWRLKNNININLVQGMEYQIKTQNIIHSSNVGLYRDTQENREIQLKQLQKNKILIQKQRQQKKLQKQRQIMKQVIQNEPYDEQQKQKQLNQLEKSQQSPLTNFSYLVKQLKRQVKIINPQKLFNHYINLHSTLRYWLLILTMIYIIMNYTSRIFLSKQIHNIVQENSIQTWRFLLFMCGTSEQSPININIYLLIVGLTIIQIKCCSLISKIGKPTDLQNKKSIQSSDMQIQIQIQQQKQKQKQQNRKFSTQQNKDENDLDISRNLKKHFLNTRNDDDHKSFNQSQFRKKSMREIQQKQNQKFADISISLRLGMNKIAQRFFVILLVFVSLLQNDNPFSIIYLICALFLNFMGAKSIQGLSWTLSFLVIIQYSLIITDTTNKYVGASKLFPNYINYSWIVQLFNIKDPLWINYLTFGKNINQLFVMYLSMIILMLYQACFYLQEYNWLKILLKMMEKIKIGFIQRKIYQHFSRIYQYTLVYSPLGIIGICLGLYLLDFTATNMFLSILSIIFIFKSFLLQDYTDSRPFWKSYFRMLQVLIVFFMIVYCILSAPMYQQYCNKILCSPEEFHTKVTKTILLLLLQIGIDLISSHYFINAMQGHKKILQQTSSYYSIAISYVQNDKKISRQFKSIKRKQQTKQKVKQIKQFINTYQNDQSIRFDNRKNIQNSNQSWLDTILQLLPSLIDAEYIKNSQQTKYFVQQQNSQFISWLEKKKQRKLTQQQLKQINQLYFNQFKQCKSFSEMKQKIKQIIKKQQKSQQSPSKNMTQSAQTIHPLKRQRKDSYLSNLQLQNNRMSQSASNIRKSYIHGIMPFDDQLQILQSAVKKQTNVQIIPQDHTDKQQQNIIPLANKYNDKQKQRDRRTIVAQHLLSVNVQQKKKLLYLLIFQSIVSNWHYFTYVLMMMQFVRNMGFLTLPLPILTFTIGLVHSYQAPKLLWRLTFISLLLPIFFKYSLYIQLIKPNENIQFILIGENINSILIQYLLLIFIVVQCVILKVVGLYDQSTAQVQCMNIALIRNIINCDKNIQNSQQQRKALFTLLQHSKTQSQTFLQYLFSIYQCKSGYDYSTTMVTIQLIILVYIFIFYDNMAIRQQLNFYKMIEYNQFTTGMVIMAFIQLSFILIDRILTVLQLSYKKWDIILILKYILLIIQLIYVHILILVFFPLNSGYFHNNKYILIFYILYILYFIISALQIKIGINKQSRGFMDRYTWYNGYIYMTYRAIPFLFQFKIFSDWTFTNTSLRLFDWIKYQELLGFLYVAKCNSLFLRGKILGSKIEWWKKLLMGFPLLLCIILLLFGPLILFSSLNPLSSLNEITGGYLQLSLKVNKTNQYPFYINTHMTDIHFLDSQPNQQLQQIIKTYQLDQKSIQIVHLQPYSDQYWEISQGSYDKLIDQPQNSLYQLTIRVKFDRNQTKTTPVFILNTFTIPLELVSLFKETLQGKKSFTIHNFVPAFMRLDNNNGLHFLTDEYLDIEFHAEESRTLKKKYWVINDGITFKIASDKYSKAIFGYSVMSFYISIILVVANYFRFLFQGSAYTIIMSDIPYADPLLDICDGIHQARLKKDIYQQQILYWTLIDVIRSPDLMKALTGNYLNARIQTLQLDQNNTILQQKQKQKDKLNVYQKKFTKKSDKSDKYE